MGTPPFTAPVPPAVQPAWNGFVANMKLPLHRWFRFSAGFPALWAEEVILETGASHVFDPFAGSATTLLASQRAGAEAVGLESQPFIFRIAHAKLQWTADPDSFLKRGREVLAQAVPKSDAGDVAPLLTKCFLPGALASLTGLRESLNAAREGDAVDELLWLALVSILRACSPVGTAQWQYVLPNKSKAKTAEPFEAFEHQLVRMSDDMRELQASSTVIPRSEVIAADSREPLPLSDKWADLVLTSPPYPNNFDYADATRLEMTFLGEVHGWSDLKTHARKNLVRSCSQHMSGYAAEDVLASGLVEPVTDELLIVYNELTMLRSERRGKKAYNLMVVAYFADLALVWENLRRAVAPGGLVGFVVGDSAPYGVHVPVEGWLGEIALTRGFRSYRFEKLRDRNHRWRNRKHRVPLHEGVLWVEG